MPISQTSQVGYFNDFTYYLTMGISPEAVIAIVGVVCTIPPCVVVLWRLYGRKGKNT